jgi:hypothetical protein
MSGDAEKARSHMLKAHVTYEQDSEGSHPAWVRKACCALLRRTLDDSADYLRLTAQLMSRAPLLPLDAMLRKRWSVSFEPDFFEHATP